MGKINKYIAQEIINLYIAGESTYALAAKFGLWNTQIGNIIRGKSWKVCSRPDNLQEIINERAKNSQFQKGRFLNYQNSLPLLTKYQLEVLDGSLLGDGHLHLPGKNGENSYFTKKQCKEFKEYVDWHYKAFEVYSCSVGEIWSDDELYTENGKPKHRRTGIVELKGHYFRSICHPYFTNLRSKWYFEGVKCIPEDLTLTPLTIAIWYCDDGSNSLESRQITMSTESFTFKEVEFLQTKLETYSLFPHINKKTSASGKIQPLLKFSAKSYDGFLELIKPFISWKCFEYKTKWRKALEQYEYSSNLQENNVIEIFELSKTMNNPQIAEIYGVHRNTISAILNDKSWRHLQHFNPKLTTLTHENL